jgi:hypothetical protein
MGQAPLPGKGVEEVVELENGATLLGHRYPCVIVCMYDVNTVSGRLLLNAGFGTHQLAVCGHALKQNAYFAPHEEGGTYSWGGPMMGSVSSTLNVETELAASQN